MCLNGEPVQLLNQGSKLTALRRSGGDAAAGTIQWTIIQYAEIHILLLMAVALATIIFTWAILRLPAAVNSLCVAVKSINSKL